MKVKNNSLKMDDLIHLNILDEEVEININNNLTIVKKITLTLIGNQDLVTNFIKTYNWKLTYKIIHSVKEIKLPKAHYL